jgi:hypothetical protein
MQLVNTDKKGNFKLDSLLFFERSRILFSDTRGKKSMYITVNLNADSLNRSYSLPALEKQRLLWDASKKELEAKLAFDYDAILKANGLMLQGITIRAKKKNPIQELDDKYASGLFSGFTGNTIDLTNSTEPIVQQNIFEYLQFRVPGIKVVNNGGEYSVYYRQAASISMMGQIPMTLFLDEMETDAYVIATVPANQVAMVKVYSTFAGAAGNSPGGTLAVYTKKGADLFDAPSTGDQLRYRGFSMIKEFYSPVYSDAASRSKADNRITLNWIPDIRINNVNAIIPVSFYNNDRTKKYKIVVEGMTIDGKLIMAEKIISNETNKRPF